MSAKSKLIPSPQATGNAGGSYEQHVGAACLSILLTGGIAPFSADSVLREVHLQARHLGFKTDDLLLIAEKSQGLQHRIAIQAKRTFLLSASNEECVNTLRAAWDDFANAELFVPENDRLALIAGHAPSSFMKGMRTLLDTARATLTAEAFSRRRSLDGPSSKDSRASYQTVATILRAHAREAATDEAIWRFLRVWDFAVLDFQSPSSVAESLVKSMLAAASDGRAGAAGQIWTTLLDRVGEGAGRAQSFDWASLPAELREHYRLPATERETCAAMQESSMLVRRGVVDRLARSLVLPRFDVLADALSRLTDTDALIVTGSAGAGKSVIAARIYDGLALDGLALAVRADTLATPHLATSAQQLGVPLRALLRLFTLHPRKLLWVESGERLFEKTEPEREAFGDFLRLIARERGWKILITCRDYSAENFLAAFLEPNGMRAEVLMVPPLTNLELDTISVDLPSVRVPLGDPELREILRNPFYLNLAVRMNWSEGSPPAITRRTFRQKAWREVVCRSGEGSSGMSFERDQVMIQVAQRRARALVPYVVVDGLPVQAVDALTRDSLLTSEPDDPTAKIAPAHDLFEDWALLQWISRLPEQTGGVNTAFFNELGTYPALRRSFRLWLLEQLEGYAKDAEGYVFAVMNNRELPAYWREEALVAVFQSASAPKLLRQLAEYLVNDATHLRRAVHLLRVSCRQPPSLDPTKPTPDPEGLLPTGLAWEAMPELILMAQPSLYVSDLLWILDFLEDWARGARMQPNPPSAPNVANLCSLLLGNIGHILDSYQETYRERILKVMLSIPLATEPALRTMIERAIAQPQSEEEGPIILKLIWSHFDGATLARDLPELTLKVVKHRISSVQAADQAEEDQGYQSMEARDHALFGLGHLSKFDYCPASAWQGPFLNLLTFHPELGIGLLLDFVNGCCLTYSTRGQHDERSIKISLEVEDGVICQQWANVRLWRLYRATNVGPLVLSSALMALETWLLIKSARGDEDLRTVFSRLLRESNNVAITAVLASVALAYPYLFGEVAVPLLLESYFFQFDLERCTHDQRGDVSQHKEYWPEQDPEKRLLWAERSESAARPHRQRHLEDLFVMLQGTSARMLLWEILDHVREQLKTLPEVNDEVRHVLLKLHRMDVRNFVVSGETEDGRLLLQAGAPSPELEAYRDRDLPAYQDNQQRTWLFLWGRHVFEGSEAEKYPPGEWKEKLAAIRALPVADAQSSLYLLGSTGAIHIESLCLRDHWDELDEAERTWCIERIFVDIESQPKRGFLAEGLRALSGGISPAAQLISLIIARGSEPSARTRAVRNLAAVLLSSERQLAMSAAYGVGAYLFKADRALALSCMGVLVDWARETARFGVAQRGLPGLWDPPIEFGCSGYSAGGAGPLRG